MYKTEITIETKKEEKNGISGRTILKVSDSKGELAGYGFHTGIRNSTTISKGKFIPETEFQSAIDLHEKLSQRKVEII